MNETIFWIGTAVWIILGALALWLIVWQQMIVGFATTCSWYRWSWQCRTERLNLRPKAILKQVLEFGAYWFRFRGHKNDGKTVYRHRSGNGYWRGIGDWIVLGDSHF